MKRDFILDNDNDLAIKDGGFVVDDCNEQDVEAILMSQKGDWKQWPLTGVGIQSAVEADYGKRELDRLEKEIRMQLADNGFNVKQIDFKLANSELLTIEPKCTRD